MLTYFTSESVFRGHPDKVCDQIADAILDAALEQDEDSKMAVECTIKDNFVLIYGEAKTKANLDYAEIARETLVLIGYDEDYEIAVKVGQQSPEINHAVASDEDDIKAGDQGIVFGYACNETRDYMPLSISLAHDIASSLSDSVLFNDGFLNPDGKTQVTVEYLNGRIVGIKTVLISVCHKPLSQWNLDFSMLKSIIKQDAYCVLTRNPNVKQGWLDNTEYIINPAGEWTVGGSFGDSGTTGRKIVVDTYGGHGRIGGGALSSKDASKVDRSGAYYARYVAKHIVAAGLASSCEIQVSYGIGMAKPISVHVRSTDATVSEKAMLEIINAHFDFSVANIIKELQLKLPRYSTTSCFGHFGGHKGTWEELPKLQDIKEYADFITLEF